MALLNDNVNRAVYTKNKGERKMYNESLRFHYARELEWALYLRMIGKNY